MLRPWSFGESGGIAPASNGNHNLGIRPETLPRFIRRLKGLELGGIVRAEQARVCKGHDRVSYTPGSVVPGEIVRMRPAKLSTWICPLHQWGVLLVNIHGESQSHHILNKEKIKEMQSEHCE